MLRSVERLRRSSLVAALILIAGAAGLAQRHFLLNAPRPQVTLQLAGMVERGAKPLPLENSTVVKPAEILGWTINGESTGNSAGARLQGTKNLGRT